MHIAIMQELKQCSFLDLQNIFNASEEELKNALKSLSLMNIVKKLSKDISKIELEELLETENLEKINSELEGNMYVFKYVGILVTGDVCLLIYPKYANSYLSDSTNGYQQLKQLISVIRKYQSKEQKIGFNNQIDADNFNLLSIALELIYSYYDYGLYSNDKQIIEQNGYGLLILDIDVINISSEKREHLGSSQYISYRINQELSSQFVTYKQNILNLMKKYIEENYGRNSTTKISFVGTNSFNLVWEDVCSVVMDDCINKSIKELGLKYSQNSKQSALLSDVISKPKWKHYVSGLVHTAKKL